MKRPLVLSLSLLLLLAALFALAATRDPQSSAKISTEQLREDFTVFRSALEEGHSGLYRRTTKPEMDRILEQTGQKLDRPMGVYDFYRVLAPVIGSVKCGHTILRLPPELGEELSEREPLLPVEVKVLGQKVYVLRDLANGDRRLAGREIRAIGGVPTPRIVETMLAGTPGDGNVMTSRRTDIDGWWFNQKLVALLGLASPYEVTVAERGTGKEETVRLTGMPLPTLRRAAEAQGPARRPDAGAPSFELRGGGKVAVMRVAEFSGPLEGFYLDAFEKMQAQGTKALIIDVRDNGGGMDHLGKDLLAYFVEEPFQYYSDVYLYKLSYDLERYVADKDPVMASMFERRQDGRYHAVNHPCWGLQQPRKPTFRGKVFVLMNGGSFSTTSEFLAHMHVRKRATFIGEEAGGSYDGNTAGFMPVVTLPHSKLRVRVPLLSYHLAVKGGDPNRGVPPDIPVEYTLDEVMAGKDKEMEVALQLARRPLSARTAGVPGS